MQLFGFNPSKVKTQCRLGVGRIKLLRNKKQLAMKQLRREVADLLRNNKHGNARIRVEAVMREHRMLQAFEILELYLELLAVRAELLGKAREMPPDMVEAICSLIYAAERVATDLAEVAGCAKLLVGKYSSVYKEHGFPHEVVSDLTCRKWQVNESLVLCLAVSAPLPEEKLMFLEDIAREHDVEFDKEAAAAEMLPSAGKPLGSAAAAAAPMPVPYAVPVEPLAAPGAGAPPSLAQGWQPPAASGWQPPGAAAPGGGAPPPQAPAGDSVWHRTGVADGAGWQPPRPDDPDQAGRAFQSHVGAAASWRQTKLAGGAAAPADAYPGAAVGLGPGAAEFPGTAPTSGDSTPGGGDKPATPGTSYTDASAAAEAAKRYSQMAAQAAQRAEEFASKQAGKGPGSPPPSSPPPGSPPPGPSGGAGGSGGSGGGGGKYVARSLSQIQRDYDAAPGPPTKADKMAGAAAGPPSAPPPPPLPAADGASTSAAGVAGGQDFDAAALPSVPSSGGGAAVGVPPPQGAGSELDELTKRFEALKKR